MPVCSKGKKKISSEFFKFFFIILKLCKDFTQIFFSKKSNWKWVKQSSTFFSSFGGPQGNRTSVHAYCLVLKAYLWRLLYPLPIGIFWKILHFWNIWIIHMEWKKNLKKSDGIFFENLYIINFTHITRTCPKFLHFLTYEIFCTFESP